MVGLSARSSGEFGTLTIVIFNRGRERLANISEMLFDFAHKRRVRTSCKTILNGGLETIGLVLENRLLEVFVIDVVAAVVRLFDSIEDLE